MPTLKEKIIAESKRIGIDKIGFATAEPFYELEASLQEQRARGIILGLSIKLLRNEFIWKKTFEDPQTIIAIALAYPTKSEKRYPMMKNEECLLELHGELIIMIFCEIACKN